MTSAREGSSSVADFSLCGAAPYFFQPDRWSCGYRNLQMMLGSLRVLQIDEEENLAHQSRPLEAGTTAAEDDAGFNRGAAQDDAGFSRGTATARSLPADLSERMAAHNEGFLQTPATTSAAAQVGTHQTGPPQEGSEQEGLPKECDATQRKVAAAALLKGGHNFSLAFGAGVVPSVYEMQGLVEQSWDKGYDPEGCKIFRPPG